MPKDLIYVGLTTQDQSVITQAKEAGKAVMITKGKKILVQPPVKKFKVWDVNEGREKMLKISFPQESKGFIARAVPDAQAQILLQSPNYQEFVEKEPAPKPDSESSTTKTGSRLVGAAN